MDGKVVEAHRAINAERVAAGREYTESLIRLGFVPDMIAWTYLTVDQRAELAIVAREAEVLGPRAIYLALLTAYEHSILPRAIDPFVVSIYGPRSDFGKSLLEKARQSAQPNFYDGRRPDAGDDVSLTLHLLPPTLQSHPYDPGQHVMMPNYGLLHLRTGRTDMMERTRRFHHFEARIESAVAGH